MKTTQHRLLIIIVIVLLNSIGFSIVLPLLPFLLGKYLSPENIVIGMSLLMSAFAICSFFAAPVFGALSDKYGRKSLLIASIAGSVIGYILFGIGGALWVLFLGRIIDGLTAGNISILFAYISDSAEPQERAKWFGYIGAAMGIGKIGGPALGGLLANISIALPFFITAGLLLLSGLAAFLLLPESLPPAKRVKHLTLSSFNTLSHFKAMLSLKGVKVLLILGVLFYVVLGIFQFNFTVFLKDVYQWGPPMVGAILTFVGVCDIFIRAFLLPRLLKRFREKYIGVAGLLIMGVGLVLILASIYLHSIVIISLAVICIISGEGLFDPTYNARLSGSVDESRQGQLQGVSQSLQSANNIVVPLAASALYVCSPALLYLAAACIIPVAVFVYIKRT